MSWLKTSLRSSLYGLLGHSQPPSQSMLDNRIEDIREAMLELIGETAAQHVPHLIRRIRYAADIQALWYLRGDLMGALADRHGETLARQQVGAITDMFKGLLPAGLASRPSPLLG